MVACEDGREAQGSMGDGVQGRAAGSVALLCCRGGALGVYYKRYVRAGAPEEFEGLEGGVGKLRA